MAEKLGEIGNVLSSIAEAVKSVKDMRNKNGQLYRIIEETKEHAVELEQQKLPEDQLLQELQQNLRNVEDSGIKLVTWIQSFSAETDSFDQSVRAMIRCNTIPPGAVNTFCNDLNKLYQMVRGFTKAFDTFVTYLKKAQELATKLSDKLKQQEQQMKSQANSREKKGIAGTGVLVLSGVGLLALGFFTGGAAWAAAGLVAGAACGAGAAAVAVTTISSVQEMRELATGIQGNASKLETLAKSLKSSSDRAGDIPLDNEVKESLLTALEFFRRDQEKDARIAELEAKLKSLGH